MRPSQQREFLDAIRGGASVTVACQRAGVSRGWPYAYSGRTEGRRFRLAWLEARLTADKRRLAEERRRIERETARAS